MAAIFPAPASAAATANTTPPPTAAAAAGAGAGARGESPPPLLLSGQAYSAHAPGDHKVMRERPELANLKSRTASLSISQLKDLSQSLLEIYEKEDQLTSPGLQDEMPKLDCIHNDEIIVYLLHRKKLVDLIFIYQSSTLSFVKKYLKIPEDNTKFNIQDLDYFKNALLNVIRGTLAKLQRVEERSKKIKELDESRFLNSEFTEDSDTYHKRRILELTRELENDKKEDVKDAFLAGTSSKPDEFDSAVLQLKEHHQKTSQSCTLM